VPLKEHLGARKFHVDAARLSTVLEIASSGAGAPHQLLGSSRHRDTENAAAGEGSLILGNSSDVWDVLTHPDAAGYAMVTDGTTWTIDQTPTWTGLHTFNADLELAEYVHHIGDADTWLRFQDDQLDVNIGGVEFITSVEGGTDYIRFNDAGADVDFGVEAVGVADALQVDGAAGRVTIGTEIYGHVKSVTAAGQIGNGPVETGEVIGLGGTSVIAPSSRLYESTTIQ